MAFLWILSCLAFIGATYSCGVPAIPPVITGSPDYFAKCEEAVPHSWPWQVSLQESSGFQFCTGSLISENWVVTAAHCNVRTYHRVILGEHNHSSNSESIQALRVSKVRIHPKYNPYNVNYDIVLIKLSSPAEMTMHVSPVCMAENTGNFPGGMKCVTTGWGLTCHNALVTNTGLRQAVLQLQTNDECRPFWGNQVTNQMICTGPSSCKAESGSPLVCQKDGAWTLVGVASWGSTRCSTSPGIYARVSELRAWIDQTIAAN
ncbi:chymotrypsin A-like [Thalassophryne amazonica]|uniref:chymotrypsin A-like n=1 Tax=Thalassophryne amazonica TaxID=390379 RepID=UPI001470FE14|nr:chymotrypsin A-like [Thalassophryne amazonica]